MVCGIRDWWRMDFTINVRMRQRRIDVLQCFAVVVSALSNCVYAVVMNGDVQDKKCRWSHLLKKVILSLQYTWMNTDLRLQPHKFAIFYMHNAMGSSIFQSLYLICAISTKPVRKIGSIRVLHSISSTWKKLLVIAAMGDAIWRNIQPRTSISFSTNFSYKQKK